MAEKDNSWRVTIKCWASNLEDSAKEQAVNLAKMPCIFHHVALAPDCHMGYAIPIGGIVAYKNAVSPYGCGNGAGRRMSRTAACQRLTVEQCDEAMKGIVCERWGKVGRGKAAGLYDLSEAPGAYKDIEEVINNELDLVEPLVRLSPLACLKG